MPLFKSDEEKAASREAKEAGKEAKAREKLRNSFYASPAGQARVAFEAGSHVFQYETDLKSTKAVVKAIGLGSSAMGKETFGSRLSHGPVDILNSVCAEGWDLVNGSFVFVETGQSSRDKFLASGQQVAVSGTVFGYYLFKRNPANKTESSDPWDVSDQEALSLAEQID